MVKEQIIALIRVNIFLGILLKKKKKKREEVMSASEYDVQNDQQ